MSNNQAFLKFRENITQVMMTIIVLMYSLNVDIEQYCTHVISQHDLKETCMKQIDRNLFVSPVSSNLEQVLTQTGQSEDLTFAQKNERCSAVRSFASWIGEPPAAIPAHPDYIRRRLSKLTPAAVGVGKKRFANVKSALMAALRHLGLVGGQHYLAPLTPSWKALRKTLPDKYTWTSLSRVFHYCSARRFWRP